MSYEYTIIQGNLGANATQNVTKDKGEPVSNFSVAVSKSFTRELVGADGEKTLERVETVKWFNCSAFGERFVRVAQYLVKGQAVLVTGRIEAEGYIDKRSQVGASLRLIVDDLRLVGGAPERKNGQANGNGNGQQQHAPNGTPNEIPF